MSDKKTASFWNNQIIKSGRLEKKWRTRGNEVVKVYRGGDVKHSPFNILYSNTETIKPAIYSATPKPDVRRRYTDANPVAKEASEVIERALSFSIDAYDFDRNIEGAVDDMLLPGRGIARVRYNPTIEEFENEVENEGINEFGEVATEVVTETAERVADQEVTCEYWYWEDFRMGSARNWVDVPWIAFRHKFTKDQFEDQFGDEHIHDVDFSFAVDGCDDGVVNNNSNKQGDNLAIVWEIWDKDEREVYWISSGVSSILETNEDPLGLKGFFPTPEPLYAVETTDTLVPLPMYDIYKTLAEELNVVEARILHLTNGLKLRGIYPNNMKELQGLLQLGDNQMLGVEDFTAFEGRKINDLIMFAPITEIAQVISTLTQQRESIKQVIFEVTGISDILRGQSKASETLGAQKIKANFGAARLENLLKRVRVFARDLIRMKGEIIASKFTPEVLQMMTGIEITPEIDQMLKNDVLRGFNIDIETDSTVAIDRSGDKQESRETLSGIVEFLTGIAPLVQGGAIPPDVAKDLLLWALRSSGSDRQVEDAISRIGEPQQPPVGAQPTPQGGGQAIPSELLQQLQGGQPVG